VAGMTAEKITTGATLLGEPLPVELMNTLTVIGDEVHDFLADDDEADAWLHAVAGRIGAEAEADRASLRGLRDALRRLAAEVTDDPRPPAAAPELTRPEAITTLNALGRTWPELVWPGDGPPAPAYRSRGDAGLAVELIAHQGVELFTGPGRELLRPCLAPNCLLFFAKDHPRRQWCSPACGNRARVARHYWRHRR
jgi:predicted RNA-binding Zn ribbon-like protein